MENNQSFALKIKKSLLKHRELVENWTILATLAFTGLFTISDIFSDLDEGADILHLGFEGFVAMLSFLGIIVLWRRKISLNEQIASQKKITANAEMAKALAISEALKWKQEASSAIKGLSDAIDNQLTRWQLTAAEKEVALLLLKGLSLKEIASIREVSEKTARAQSFAIYSKSGLGGRAELSAFFLEDLMLPSEPTSKLLESDFPKRPESFM